MDKTRIAVIDEQELFRAGVRRVLSAYSGFEIAECAPSEGEMPKEAPDIVLLGCSLNTPNGLDFSRMIARRYPNARVIILSPDPEDEELFDIVKSSAVACMNKNASGSELVAAVRRAAAGEGGINGSIMSGPTVARPDARGAMRQYRRDSYFDSRGRETHEALTSREVEILSYVAGGNTNRQIASALQISEQTIKNHISHILRRSKANDRAHAVFLAIRQGLISVGAESAG